MESGRKSPRPRERIVSTARDLFHRRGIRAVGIDTIAEGVPGPRKPDNPGLRSRRAVLKTVLHS